MKHIGQISIMLSSAISFYGPAVAQNVPPPVLFTPSATPHGTPHSFIIPNSSQVRAEDLGKRAHTNVRFLLNNALNAKPEKVSPEVGPPFSGYGYETPASLACLYGLASVTAGCNPNTATAVSTKGSKAVAIVDAYHYGTALADLQKYSTQFGLPAPNLTVLYATSAGACNGSKPAVDYGWEVEEALDIQMVHALAPNAKIYLVEAQSNSNSDLLGAVQCANSQLTAVGAGELSMSWGQAEFSGETTYDSYFSTSKVVYFASSGDSPGVSWPSASAKVVSVGGMSNSRAFPSFNFEYYSTWSEGGGGISAYVARPSYQNIISGIVGSFRGTPDIAADANPDTGVWVYDSNAYYGVGWYNVGGTSVASPLMAALTNAAGSFHSSTAAELSSIYAAKGASPTLQFATATTGYCGPYASATASIQWNICVGVGTTKGPTVTPLVQR